MMAEPGPRQLLARRLRALREDSWPGRKITQQQLARAFGVSVPLISSWESPAHPKIPPLARLDAYARLFATERSFDADPAVPIAEANLPGGERQLMNDLRLELRQLRNAALRAASVPAEIRDVRESLEANPWRFRYGDIITMVCAQLPPHMRDRIPYTDVDDPDYIDMLTYSELDSMFELHGHLRAANPGSHVYLRTAGKLAPDDYHTHLAVLGGIDWNVETRAALDRLGVPVRQVAHWDEPGEQYFEVAGDGAQVKHRPVLLAEGDRTLLVEDVALFVRAVNPFNRERTITLCNGMYGRGSYGAIRALTDMNFRDRNSEYLQSRFGNSSCYCILTRVKVIHGVTLTPDWASGDDTLFEWSV